ncbi:MAG: class I SAM-dependent methyltransferase [Saprospiraceae bacterium]|nr:class I SAM-dependent methyltransferase [Candidatus Vicinibacter affinis]
MDNYNHSFHTWDKLAEEYENKFMDLDLYNDTYDLFCQKIGVPQAKILEIACGPGNISKYLFGKREDFIIEGFDVSPNMIQLAKKNIPAGHFWLLDCRELHLLKKIYDGIICGFCLPYLSKEDVEKLIKDCSNLLSHNGLLYISTIEGDYNNSNYEFSSSGQEFMYVYQHQADYLSKYFITNGFSNPTLIRKYYPKSNGIKDTHLIMIAQKK